MKKAITLLFAFWAVAAVSGCMGQAKTMQYVAFPRTGEEFTKVDNPRMGRIYIARPTNLEHSKSFTILDGNTKVADIGPYGYACWERKPGKTTLITYHVDGDSYKHGLIVERGKVYYFQMYCWPVANSNIRPRTTNEGFTNLIQCRPPDIF